jgi:EAL domain-containing protein (putative c-di-GMP-specific phosphodiesterase class I)/GGDEF domain-containing protein
MEKAKGVSWAFWRGISDQVEENPSTLHRARVLLLVGSSGNRKQLAKQLEKHYQVIMPDEAVPDETALLQGPDEAAYDLAIVDFSGMQRWRQALMEARKREQPAFLPSMLISSRGDLFQALQFCHTLIDEFLFVPIDPSELAQRVAMLLRARRQALMQSVRLAYLTSHDPESGLPNKTLFLDRLGQAVQDATVLHRRVYALVVHIPLGPVLKSLGNRALEKAGLACCERLAKLLREEHSLSRISKEEWGLMLRAGATTDDVLEIFRNIQKLTTAPLNIQGERIHVSPAVGIAIYPDDASDAHALLDCASAALARSDQATRPNFYSRNVQRQALEHIRTEAGLHEALAKEQFELWLQPKISLQSRSLVSVEALIRWRLPGGELVPPGNFIPVAESTGLIIDIDRWVLAKACEYMSVWKAQGGPSQIAVNISAQHLDKADFVTTVTQLLAQYTVSPTALELELTETALAELTQENLAKLEELRNLGVSIALDDFGTGYCSLNYLHKLPITTLKIDKSFIDHIATNNSDAAITQAIVSLAKNFQLKLVAEGIETEDQLNCLLKLEVNLGQGYFFARPMPFAELENWDQVEILP